MGTGRIVDVDKEALAGFQGLTHPIRDYAFDIKALFVRMTLGHDPDRQPVQTSCYANVHQ